MRDSWQLKRVLTNRIELQDGHGAYRFQVSVQVPVFFAILVKYMFDQMNQSKQEFLDVSRNNVNRMKPHLNRGINADCSCTEVMPVTCTYRQVTLENV